MFSDVASGNQALSIRANGGEAVHTCLNVRDLANVRHQLGYDMMPSENLYRISRLTFISCWSSSTVRPELDRLFGVTVAMQQVPRLRVMVMVEDLTYCYTIFGHDMGLGPGPQWKRQY